MVDAGPTLEDQVNAVVGGGPLATSADEALTARDAARRLHISERTIRRAIARGELVATKRGRAYRITSHDLARYRAAPAQRVRPIRPPPATYLQPLGTVPSAVFRHATPPTPLTPLVGRRREAALARDLLRQPEVRLLTLTGLGGVGKTRLALAVAAALGDDFADGIGFVDLAPVRDPGLVATTIAQTLGARGAGDQPALRRIATHLGGRRVLLVLDNLEQILPAAPVITQLLSASPRLAILATSRAPLRLDGEHCFVVPPLGLPEDVGGDSAEPLAGQLVLGAIAQSEAVRLFVERATAAQADFALTATSAPIVGEICRRLDGLPLAVELAAARCAVLSPGDLLDRLERRLPLLTSGRRDAPPRMRSLHDTLTWSHDLLTVEEQVAFRRLAVFTGGFTLDAAEAFVGEERQERERANSSSSPLPPSPPEAAQPPPPEAKPAPPERSGIPSALDLVTSLHAKSLLTRHEEPVGTVRFGMLETIREYALECLAASGEEIAFRRRHAEHFLGIVERTDRLVPRPDHWWGLFETEWDNLRAALSWTVEADQPGIGLRLGGALFGYWMLRGQIGEGVEWLERLLATGASEPPTLRGRAAMALGFLHWIAGDLNRAATLAVESMTLAEATGDTIGVAASRFLQGFLAEAQGDLAVAARHLTDARDRYDAAGLANASAAAAGHLGRVLWRQGDRATAKALLTGAVAVLDREGGSAWGSALAYTDLGLVAADEDDSLQAAALIDTSLRQQLAMGDQLAILLPVTAAARVVAKTDCVAAARLLGAVSTLRERAGPSVWTVAQPVYDEAVSMARDRLGEAVFVAAWDAGGSMGVEEAIAAARGALAAITGVAISNAERLPGAVMVPLSARELAVMRLVAAGQTDQEIAAVLGLRLRTVNSRVANVRRKLRVPSRAAAAAEMVRRGLA